MEPESRLRPRVLSSVASHFALAVPRLPTYARAYADAEAYA